MIAFFVCAWLLTAENTCAEGGCPDGAIVICIVAYNRPHYLRRVLQNLADAEGIQQHRTMFFLEPGNQEVLQLAQGFNASRHNSVHQNANILGCHPNIRSALRSGFQHGEFVVLLEDDIVLSKDSLVWFVHAMNKYRNDPTVFSVSTYGDTCHASSEVIESDLFFSSSRRKHFTPWGWGMWKDRYDDISRDYSGWDTQMNFQVHMATDNSGTVSLFRVPATNFKCYCFQVNYAKEGLRKARHEVFPVLSRSNNIGLEQGIHSDLFTKEQMSDIQNLKFWGQNLDTMCKDRSLPLCTQQFQEVPESGIQALCEQVSFGNDTAQALCGADPTVNLVNEKPEPFTWTPGEGPPLPELPAAQSQADARVAQVMLLALFKQCMTIL